MKIISKHKDYYDFLMGIYGVDEKIPLERKGEVSLGVEHDNYDRVWFSIADTLIEGIFFDGKWRYGDEILDVIPGCREKTEDTRKNYAKWKPSVNKSYHNTYAQKALSGMYCYYSVKNEKGWWRGNEICKEKIKVSEEESVNVKLNCPIVGICRGHKNSYNSSDFELAEYLKYPVLKDYDLAGFLPAHDIWVMLSEWIARERYKEGKTDILDNTQKILSHGFDKKTSFRGKIK